MSVDIYDTSMTMPLLKDHPDVQRIDGVIMSDQDQVRAVVQDDDRLGRVLDIHVVREHSVVADGAAIYALDHNFIFFLSPKDFPEAAEEQRRAMMTMADELGTPLNDMILPVIGSGRLRNRSYLIVQQCTPLRSDRLSRFLQTPKIAAEILAWLRDLTLRYVQNGKDSSGFRPSLDALVAMEGLPPELQAKARNLSQAIAARTLSVTHVPMHGDLWRNNIMRRKDGRLILIDWSGSLCRGYAIYDLVRLHQSLRLSQSTYTKELQWYVDTLGGRSAVEAHLLGALGHYARNLGEFPRENFIALASDCFGLLTGGLARTTDR